MHGPASGSIFVSAGLEAGNGHSGPGWVCGATAVMVQKGEGLKMVRGNQVPGERAGVKSRWSPPCHPRPPRYLSVWQSRGARPRMASRGRSRHRVETPANTLASRDSTAFFSASPGASGKIPVSPLGASEHRGEDP